MPAPYGDQAPVTPGPQCLQNKKTPCPSVAQVPSSPELSVPAPQTLTAILRVSPRVLSLKRQRNVRVQVRPMGSIYVGVNLHPFRGKSGFTSEWNVFMMPARRGRRRLRHRGRHRDRVHVRRRRGRAGSRSRTRRSTRPPRRCSPPACSRPRPRSLAASSSSTCASTAPLTSTCSSKRACSSPAVAPKRSRKRRNRGNCKFNAHLFECDCALCVGSRSVGEVK